MFFGSKNKKISFPFPIFKFIKLLLFEKCNIDINIFCHIKNHLFKLGKIKMPRIFILVTHFNTNNFQCIQSKKFIELFEDSEKH